MVVVWSGRSCVGQPAQPEAAGRLQELARERAVATHQELLGTTGRLASDVLHRIPPGIRDAGLHGKRGSARAPSATSRSVSIIAAITRSAPSDSEKPRTATGRTDSCKRREDEAKGCGGPKVPEHHRRYAPFDRLAAVFDVVEAGALEGELDQYGPDHDPRELRYQRDHARSRSSRTRRWPEPPRLRARARSEEANAGLRAVHCLRRVAT